MSGLARKCDIRGALYEAKTEKLIGREVWIRKYNEETDTVESNTYDVCPACMGSLFKFITKDQNTEESK